MDDSSELIPDYLRFVKGVVDAADLSLNISREILQQDRHIQMIRRRLIKKVLSTIKDLLSSAPDKYSVFWREFGRALKEGLLSDQDNQKSILDVCSFATTAGAEPTTLADYVSRMKEGQDEIYFLTGESRSQVENSPHMEAFQAQGYEVLILTDQVDEIWVEAVPDYDGKKFQSISRGEVDLPKKEDEPETPEGDFAGLLTFLKGALEEQVKDVRLSHRLTTSAACLVSDNDDMSPMLEKMYRAMGQDAPRVKRILELNPGHPLIGGLRAAHEADAAAAGLTETAELLYGTA
jgi:molecular chaperone HtpG